MIRSIILLILVISIIPISINLIRSSKSQAYSNKQIYTYIIDNPEDKSSYQANITKWRSETETKLKSDRGWLTVAGLYWLKEGENRIGTDASNDIILPKNSAPAHIGTIVFNKEQAIFRPVKEVTINLENKVLDSETILKPDASGSPDILTINDLSLSVIKRGERYGIRLRDKNSSFRKNFKGLHWYEINESFRVEAKFIPHDQPKTLSITNVLGDVSNQTSPGYVIFTLNGQEYRLEAEISGNGLFFNFKDLSSGKTTYPAGRFLYTDAPKDGKVVLDFNKAVNPPCAFTPYATCPLPPEQNRLALKIEAGELTYHFDEEF
jgi:uncharacterized protein (DUF1684 family)